MLIKQNLQIIQTSKPSDRNVAIRGTKDTMITNERPIFLQKKNGSAQFLCSALNRVEADGQ